MQLLIHSIFLLSWDHNEFFDKNRLESLNSRLEELLNERVDMNKKLTEMDKKLEAFMNYINDFDKVTEFATKLRPSIEREQENNNGASRISSENRVHSPSNLSVVTLKSKSLKQLMYPNSNVARQSIEEKMKSWNIDLQQYSPPQYTSKKILMSLNADTDLLNL